jgi:hypothetical protein
MKHKVNIATARKIIESLRAEKSDLENRLSEINAALGPILNASPARPAMVLDVPLSARCPARRSDKLSVSEILLRNGGQFTTAQAVDLVRGEFRDAGQSVDPKKLYQRVTNTLQYWFRKDGNVWVAQ